MVIYIFDRVLALTLPRFLANKAFVILSKMSVQMMKWLTFLYSNVIA